MMTIEHLLVQVDTEGSATLIAAVDRARSLPLRSTSPQLGRQSQLIQYTLHRKLPLDVGKIN
jgi:nucleotide-binding universal stress UspA family protein